MKRINLIGLLLLAIFALSAIAASSASAEAGFLLSSANKAPTLANILGAVSKLETVGGAEIECLTLDETHFEFTSDKHATVTLHWLHCTTAGKLFALNSLGDKSGEILVSTLLLVCLDPKNGTTLVAEYGVAGEVSKVHLEIPSVGTLIEVNGTVLGSISTTGAAKLFAVSFSGAQGMQKVTECLEGSNKKVHNLTIEENHNGKPLAASENVAGGLIQFDSAENVVLMDS